MQAAAPVGIGQAQHHRVGNARMLQDRRLDLGRKHIDAARFHHVGPAVGDVEVAVFVQPAEIADGYEAVGGSTGRLATPIFEADAVSGKGTKENLADLAGRSEEPTLELPSL